MAKSKKPSMANPGESDADKDTRTPLEKEAERQEQELVGLINRTKLNDGIAALRRRAVDETEFGHLAEMSASVFSEENVKKIYGGGDYKVQFKTAAGKFVGSASFKIDYSIPAKYPGKTKPEEDRNMDRTPEIITAVTTAVKSSIPPPPAQDNSLVLELIRQLGAQNAAMMQAIASNKPATDPAMAATIAELRAELRSLRDQAGNNRAPSLGNQIKDFMALQELIGGGSGGGESETPKTDWKEKLLEIFGPVAAQMLMRGMNLDPNNPQQQLTPEQQAQMAQLIQSQQTQQPQLPAAAQPGATASPTPTQPVTDMTPLFKIYLLEFKRLALQAATKGRDAFEWADSKIDDIDVKYHEKIFELANKETWFAEIFGADVTAQAHMKWLLDMRNMILTRWLVADVVKTAAITPRPEPAAYAGAFVDRSSVSFHDELFNLTEPDNWKDAFALHDVDAVWLEQIRAEFDKLLGESEETEKKPAAAAGSEKAPAPRKSNRVKS